MQIEKTVEFNEIDNMAVYSICVILRKRFFITRYRLILHYYKKAGWYVTFVNLDEEDREIGKNYISPYNRLISGEQLKSEVINKLSDGKSLMGTSLNKGLCALIDSTEEKYGKIIL
jgi:hypothetical protein